MEAAKRGTRQVQVGAAGTPGAVIEEAAQDLDLWTSGRGPGGRGGGRAAGAAAGAAPRQRSLLSPELRFSDTVLTQGPWPTTHQLLF